MGDTPSTLRITLPEIYLKDEDVAIKQDKVNIAMDEYLLRDVFCDEVDGMIYVERQVECGTRQGLMVCVDLDEYDYTVGSKALIRATEGTIEDRLRLE